MSSLADAEKSTVKLRFGRPLISKAAKLDILDTGGKSGHDSLARLGGSGEATVCTTTGLCTFGIAECVFGCDSVNDKSVIGFIPKDFAAFDGVMSKENGGFGIDAKGGLVGFESVGKGGNVSYASGDKVTIKLDFLEGLASVTVESSAGKKKTDGVVFHFDPRAMRGVCFPACSLAASGAAVSIDKAVDHTGVDGFVKKLAGGAHMKGGKSAGTQGGDQYFPDAFGSFWMRLHCRMKDTDTVKVAGSSTPFTKSDVLAQMLLCGVDAFHHATASCVASVGECPAIERQRTIFFHATSAMFTDGSRSAPALKDALKKAPLPLVHGQGGAYSPFSFFAAALVNYMDAERESSISQVQHALLHLQNRVDAIDGKGGGDGGGGAGSSGSFLPDIRKKTGVGSGGGGGGGGHAAPAPKAPAGKPSAKTTTAFAKEPAKAPAAKPGAKPSAKPAGKASAAGAGGGGGGGAAMSGSNIMQTMRALQKRAEEVHTLSQKGSPTDDDLKKLEIAKEKMSKEKAAAAKTIGGLPDNAAALKALDDDAKAEIMDFFEDMVGEGDHVDGNIALAQALIAKIPLEWSQFVGSKHLDSVAAYDGSLEYLEIFLALPDVETDTVDLLQNAMFNQSRRIPAVLCVLKYEAQLGLEDVVEEVADTWQEFFEDICSNAKSIPREDRTGRMDLISQCVHHKVLTVDPMKEGADGQTVFSRAAKEGDLALMKLLLKETKIDVNKVSTDTTTALIQAVVANEVEAVKLILAQPKINVGHVSQEGSALFLSRALHRDAAIVKALEGAK